MDSIGNEAKKIVIRVIIAAVGLSLAGVGVGVFLHCNLGVDPASVLIQGIGNVIHLRYGVTAAIINIVILAVVLCVDRSYINISSILAVFLIGFTADITSVGLSSLITVTPHIVVRYAMLLVGCAIMSIGIATYIRAKLGVGAIDLVSEIISDKIGLPYRWVRIACDVSFVAIGFSLGGIVGTGTLIAALLTGPLVSLSRRFVYKIIDSIEDE